MDARVILRLGASAAALFVTAQVVGALKTGLLAALGLTVVLTLLGSIAAWLWPEAGPGGPGLIGWLASAVILYVIQFALPIYRVSPFGALAAGGLFWLLDQIAPIVFD